MEKHATLRYCCTFRELIGLQPGTRCGVLRVVMTSPSMSGRFMPMLGIIGIPSLTEVMTPNCHPPSKGAAKEFFGAGGFHRALTTKFRLMSKADRPLVRPKS